MQEQAAMMKNMSPADQAQREQTAKNAAMQRPMPGGLSSSQVGGILGGSMPGQATPARTQTGAMGAAAAMGAKGAAAPKLGGALNVGTQAMRAGALGAGAAAPAKMAKGGMTKPKAKTKTKPKVAAKPKTVAKRVVAKPNKAVVKRTVTKKRG